MKRRQTRQKTKHTCIHSYLNTVSLSLQKHIILQTVVRYNQAENIMRGERPLTETRAAYFNNTFAMQNTRSLLPSFAFGLQGTALITLVGFTERLSGMCQVTPPLTHSDEACLFSLDQCYSISHIGF